MEDQTSEDKIYYCSNCGEEVSMDAKTCPKCGAELTIEEESLDDEQTVVIKTFMNEFEAEIAKDLLEEEGIEAFLSKDDEGSMNPALQLTQGVRLHIFEKDQDKAIEILNSMNA